MPGVRRQTRDAISRAVSAFPQDNHNRPPLHRAEAGSFAMVALPATTAFIEGISWRPQSSAPP